MHGAFSLLSDKLRPSVGFDSATHIQQKAIPLVLDGKNVLITSPTGSGKTEAAFLPALDLFLKNPSQGIGILYITPLKSLNRDIILRIERLASSVGLRAEVRHGDTSQGARRKQALSPPNILIITPETLQAIFCGKRLREHLKGVRFVIVDEVHELAESKRGSQLAVALERLVDLAGEFQRIGLSATVGEKKKVAAFLCGSRPCEAVNVSAAKGIWLMVESPVFSEKMRGTSNALLMKGEGFARLNRVKELVGSHKSSLVFVNTRETAESLASKLIAWNCPIGIHHSSLGKEARIQTENGLKGGLLRGIVCTSSLELGIDIGDIDLVVQYGSPRQVSKLLQRVGRSGHSIPKRSKGVIIASDVDDICESAAIAKMALSGRLEGQRVHELPLDVLGNQVVGMVMEDGVSPEHAYSTLRRAYPFRRLSKETFGRVLAQLSDSRLIVNEPDMLTRRGKSFHYYFENLSMIPDDRQYRVVSIVDRKMVGKLDEGFIAEYCGPGDSFICRGQAWSVVSLEDDTLLVEPSRDLSSAVPSWEGELLPVPFEVAREVGAMRRLVEEYPERAEKALLEEYPIDEECARRVSGLLRKQQVMPTDKRVLIEGMSRHVVIHACLGSRANDTLGKILSSVFSERFGESIGVRFDPCRVIIELPEVENGAPEEVKKILLSLDPGNLRPLVISAVEKSSMARLRSLQVAKKLGMIRKDADYRQISMARLNEMLRGTVVFDEVMREILQGKMDLHVVSGFLKELKSGALELKVAHGFSPLCLDKLESLASLDLISPKKPDAEILDLFRQRILQRRIELVCLNCGAWSGSFMIESLPDLPKCPKCTARLLALNKSGANDALKVVKKFLRGEALSNAESAYYRHLRFSADTVLTYGKHGIIALGGRGIGPRSAVRVLSRMHKEEGKFLKDLLEQERLYAKNKRFWS